MKDKARDKVDSLRLFVGIRFPEAVAQETQRIRKYFKRKNLFLARWTKSENLHLTLKFLGEVDCSLLPQITNSLASVKTSPTNAALGELGTFSSKKLIRILWIHILGNGVLSLQKQIDHVLSNQLELENRFMSHLTIARVKSVIDRDRLLNEISHFQTESLTIVIDKFSLLKSHLTSEGPVYTTVATYPLKSTDGSNF